MNTPNLIPYTRWVEIKLANGQTVKSKRRPTLVPEGQPKPDLRPDIASEWIRNYEERGHTVIKIGFKYCKR